MNLTPDEAEILWAVARGSEAWTTHPLAQRLVEAGFVAVDGQWLKLTELGRTRSPSASRIFGAAMTRINRSVFARM